MHLYTMTQNQTDVTESMTQKYKRTEGKAEEDASAYDDTKPNRRHREHDTKIQTDRRKGRRRRICIR